MNIIEVKDVSFSYDNKKQILKNINMNFNEGKVYGIYGKSGAGKSTLLSLLAGLEKTKTGDILYKNVDIDKISREKYRSNNVGIIFQSFNLLSHLTALENVILTLDISNVKIKNKKEYALKLLCDVGIDDQKANRRVLMLSGGEQQRVSIARALASDPSVIIADEPTGNLDRETETDIINILINLAHKNNKCVIIVSHSLFIKDKVDIVYYLEQGKLKEL